MITLCERCLRPLTNPEEHGHMLCPFENRRQATAIFRDEIPGGQVYENYGPKLVKFYSHSERREYMKAHGLNEAERFCPMPGTDKDPAGIPNPKGYIDAQTLENARILLSRVKKLTEDTFNPDSVIVNRTDGVLDEDSPADMEVLDAVRESVDAGR